MGIGVRAYYRHKAIGPDDSEERDDDLLREQRERAEHDQPAHQRIVRHDLDGDAGVSDVPTWTHFINRVLRQCLHILMFRIKLTA